MTDRNRRPNRSNVSEESNTERIEQDDRNMEAGSRTDENEGSEGVEEQAQEQTDRESMEEAEE